ncbi:hypothetical protein GALL_115170 [mine drainage metagenome]|uniref:Tetratricopeptide repeat protein n=1 Tax=mine drainage metagenome TaxID=410659 RepID=A0A1J5SD72_9ZZZZ
MPARTFRSSAALRVLLLWLAAATLVHAQSAHWSPSGGTLEVGKVDTLSLVFDDCEPKSDPVLPQVPNLTLQQEGKSSSFSMVNFKTSRSITYTYAAQLTAKQSVDIPAFDVPTDKGTIHVPAAHYDPADATIGSSQQPASDVVHARLLVPRHPLWAGQVFPVTYELEVRRDYYNQILSNPEWNPAPLAAEDWVKPTRASGNTTLRIPFTTRAYAKDPGTYTLGPVQQQVSVQTGTTQGFFFSQPVLETLAVPSDQPTIVVKPLPKPAPAGFAGAVGQFTFTSKVIPHKARVGDPITWTLTLKGTGNWPDIGGVPARSVPQSFEVIQPQAKRTMEDNKLFDGSVSEDVVMIPKQPGLYTLPSVTFSYFDPETGGYKTITTEPVTLDIEGAAPAPTTPTAAGATVTGAAQPPPSGPVSQATIPSGPPTSPNQPALLPSDPEAGRANAWRPVSTGVAAGLFTLPFVALLAGWMVLATLRAKELDPARPRREAARRLNATLEAMLAGDLAKTPGEPLRGALRAWQRDTAALLGLATAAPSADELTASGAPDAEAFAALWRETEAALYGEHGPLPADWVSRALDAVSRHAVPAFRAASLFKPRHLAPWFFAAAALLALAGAAPALRAATKGDVETTDPAKAYAAGDFLQAATAWQHRVDAHPTDWRARNNLGLALLQQGQAETAVSQLAVAFLHAPTSTRVLSNFRLAMQDARLSPDVLGELAMEHPLSDLARLASPAGWQLVLVLAAILAAFALGLALLRGYGRRIPGVRWISPALLGVALLATALSVMCLGAYGLSADRNATLVAHTTTLYSIPTEAETAQKTSALSAGVMGRVDREFLGWRHVTFPGGQAGWVRREDLVMLWR